jgi:hypothetical protein
VHIKKLEAIIDKQGDIINRLQYQLLQTEPKQTDATIQQSKREIDDLAQQLDKVLVSKEN